MGGDLFKDFAKILAGGVLASAVTLWGSTLDYWNKGREIDLRMVDVALTILSAKNEGTNSRFARRYALDLLEEYGGVKIKDKEKWVIDGDLPIGEFPLTKSASSSNSKWKSSNGVDVKPGFLNHLPSDSNKKQIRRTNPDTPEQPQP